MNTALHPVNKWPSPYDDLELAMHKVYWGQMADQYLSTSPAHAHETCSFPLEADEMEWIETWNGARVSHPLWESDSPESSEDWNSDRGPSAADQQHLQMLVDELGMDKARQKDSSFQGHSPESGDHDIAQTVHSLTSERPKKIADLPEGENLPLERSLN